MSIRSVAIEKRDRFEWRDKNPELLGNIRDYATIEQLVVLSNLESINAMLVHQGLIPSELLMQLNKMAIIQSKSLVAIGKIQRRLALQGG